MAAEHLYVELAGELRIYPRSKIKGSSPMCPSRYWSRFRLLRIGAERIALFFNIEISGVAYIIGVKSTECNPLFRAPTFLCGSLKDSQFTYDVCDADFIEQLLIVLLPCLLVLFDSTAFLKASRHIVMEVVPQGLPTVPLLIVFKVVYGTDGASKFSMASRVRVALCRLAILRHVVIVEEKVCHHELVHASMMDAGDDGPAECSESAK